MEAEKFGRLVDINAREAWIHEAHEFTPWLADNLDRLSDSVGIPLDLAGREVRVGPYSADLLAQNAHDGARVLIENQLAGSDHGHLGQILTYLAGLEAQTVIWIAPNFREEHLSALRWLNQHSDERFSFFAVRLRVVRIGSSPMAPLFEVVEQPNAWERQLQSKAEAAIREPSALGPRRSEFWARYQERHPDIAMDRSIAGNSVKWRQIPDISLVVSRYIAQSEVGIFIRGSWGNKQSVQDILEDKASELEEKLGVKLGKWDYPFDKKYKILSDTDLEWDNAID